MSNITDIEQLADRDSFENVTIGALGPDADPAILAGKELYRCTLRNIQLHASQWSRTRLEECVVESCDLSHANTARLTLRDVTFKNCRCRKRTHVRNQPTRQIMKFGSPHAVAREASVLCQRWFEVGGG